MGTVLAMTFKTAMKLPILALSSALALSACGSSSDQGSALKTFVGGVTGIGKKTVSAPQQSVDIAAALKNSSGPLTLVARGNLQALVIQIEQNGPYRTYGSSDRSSMTFRQGMLTATRGLGDDLMAANVSDSLTLVSARKSGSAKRVMHFLNGANEQIALEFSCTLSVKGASQVSQGAVSARTTDMTETCTRAGQTFTNVYKVDGSGMILASRQWISPTMGSFDFAVLRR